MNLLGKTGVYPKGIKRTKGNKPTQAQYDIWAEQKLAGCSVDDCKNGVMLETHHCETKAGCQKDHDKTICLCYYHHRGAEGFHTIGRKEWQRKYKTEQYHMMKWEVRK